MSIRSSLPILLALLVACTAPEEDSDDSDSDSGILDVDTGADTDSDADSDTEADSDTDTDTDTDSDTDSDSDTQVPDGDSDGIPDAEDNCADAENAGQEDRDSDDLGDACDPCADDADNDADSDGFCADLDVCPDVFDDQADTDGDGFGDACGCDEDTWRDYSDGVCKVCPAGDITSDLIDFDDARTVFDPETLTLHFALKPGAQIVSGSAQVGILSFDEYGDTLFEGTTEVGSVFDRVLSFTIDADDFDPHTSGIDSVTLTLTDACGTTTTLDDLVMVVQAAGDELITHQYRAQQCVEQDLGSALGVPVASESTQFSGIDHSAGSALETSSPDIGFLWTAPFDGRFIGTTFGSNFDTVLYLLAAECDGDPLQSSDNAGDGSQSRIYFDALLGEQFVLVAAGYADNTGDVVLNIEEFIEL